MKNRKILLGTGVLNWNRYERIENRYGTVKLFVSADEEEEETVRFDTSIIGKHGKLIAAVRESRQSYHIGDAYHKIKPTTPKIGEEIILGIGSLFFYGNSSVGLKPDDKRETLWLNIKELYKAHHQTVDLFFEEDKAS